MRFFQIIRLCSISKMEKSVTKLQCPPEVRGMKVLDRTKFTRNIDLLTLVINQKYLSKVQKLFKKYILRLDNFKPVQSISETLKCLYLDPDLVSCYDDIENNDKTFLNEIKIDQSHFVTKNIQLGYENWKTDQIFKAVLPQNEEIVSGFSHIGHIIHLNLKEHLLDYKKLIGEVLVDKIKTCRTVVNKVNTIDNTYRNFSMELLAGDEDYMVVVKENNCTFTFDFSKVYWNPRLHKEHERIIAKLEPSDILFDIFAGVGPFSIPARKKKCIVYSNDLNPESFKYLKANAQLNKVDKNDFYAFNLDGAEFIKTHLRNFLIELNSNKIEISKSNTIHITMNLPALAIEFLSNFSGLLNRIENINLEHNIIVHVYCFVCGTENLDMLAQKSAEKFLGYNLNKRIIEIFRVRNVAPAKEMIRISFRLTNDILKGCANSKRKNDESLDVCKKICKNVIE